MTDAKTVDTTGLPAWVPWLVGLVVIALCVWLIPDWDGNRANGAPAEEGTTPAVQGTLAPPTEPVLTEPVKVVAPPALPEEDE